MREKMAVKKNGFSLLIKIVVVSLLILCTPVLLKAATESRQYPCYRLVQAPVVDGNLDDAVWQNLPEATGFHIYKSARFAYQKPTSFRMGWYKNCLYLAVRCKEPFNHYIKALTNDDDNLWDDDSIEFFLAPDATNYYQFIANSVGARFNSKNAPGIPPREMWNWRASTHISGDYWTLEMSIPFSVVGATPREGDRWKFNLGRNVTIGPPGERYSSWAPVVRGFADVSNFATIIFKSAPVAEEVAAAEQEMGAEFHAYAEGKPAVSGNVVVNGSFEEGKTGWSTWEEHHPELVSVDAEISTDGGKSICLDGSGGAGYFIDAQQVLKLKPATKYILRCDIKRSKFSGGTKVAVIERDSKDAEWTYHDCGAFPVSEDKPNAWGRYELRFKTSDRLLESMLMIYNINSGAVAWYDNIELIEDDGSETGGDLGLLSAKKNLRFEMEVRDASANLLVNGEVVKVTPGQPISATIREGITVIGVDARAQGQNPGVKVRITGEPLTDGRWRVYAQDNLVPAWITSNYDDNNWPMATTDAQGFLWSADRSAQHTLLRQVILWNEGHDGPDICINPPIKEWGISEGSAETLFLALYSPFPYPLDGYEFLFDVPREFRLLDIMYKEDRGLLNVLPSKMTMEEVVHDGRPYTRYRIAYPKDDIRADRISGLLLPVFLEKWPDTNKTTAWYYRRVAKGNFTELQQKIPVRILPPINGRLPKKIMISQYCAGVWWWSTRLTPEHLDQHLRQSFQAGFNNWSLDYSNISQNPYLKTINDRVLEAGGRIIFRTNYPLVGAKDQAVADLGPGPGLLYQWLEKNPSARARYFEDSETWEKRGQYCPTYALGEGREAFLKAVKETYRLQFNNLPGASILWSDMEEMVWVSGGDPYSVAREGKESWCFCDRCKESFRKWANLPADADLSDQNIFKNYKDKWASFRVELDGKIAGLARQASNELGRPYIVYSWSSYKPYWTALKGNIDLAFQGCPGFPVADGPRQKEMDEVAVFCHDQVGLDRSKVMGQRFGFLISMKPKTKWPAFSPSGYMEPKTWKSQIMRVVAAFGLGVDLESSMGYPGGTLYWIGEATRILVTYEDLFYEGERADGLALCDKLEYPNVLVLKRGSERLVLLFNGEDSPLTVTLQNKDVKPGQTAAIYGTNLKTKEPAEMKVTIPAQDVAVVYIK